MGESGTVWTRLLMVVSAVAVGFCCWTAQANAYVFWGYSAPSNDTSGIGRANQDGSGISGTEISVSGRDLLDSTHTLEALTHIRGGVAVGGDYAYWGWTAPSVLTSGIGRAKLNGSDNHGTFISVSGSDQLGGVAVDTKYVYWGWTSPNLLTSGIGRAKLNGSSAQGTFIPIPGSDRLDGVAVDGKYVYWGWSSPTDLTSGIGRAKLNGTDARDSFISVSGSDQLAGVTVDANYVYWAWTSPTLLTSGIGRAKLDGSSPHGTFISVSGSDQLAGVAADAKYVYWGWTSPNLLTSGVGRAELDGASPHGTFIAISGSNRLGGLAVGGPPVDTSKPTVSGTLRERDKLTGKPGSWLNAPTGYHYRWQRCHSNGSNCRAIAGASHQTYVLTGSDAGRRVRLQVEAGNASGESSWVSSATTAVVLPLLPPVNLTPPSIAPGSAVQGMTLTEVHGSWSHSPSKYSYQWEDCNAISTGNCGLIPGATKQSYTLTATDVGDVIRVLEQATNDGGTAGPATSAATSRVLPPIPVNNALPLLSGTTTIGQTLMTGYGTWTNDPPSYQFEWEDCDTGGENCVLISGASVQTYTLTATDVGHTIRALVFATNAGGTGGPAISPASSTVVPLAPTDETLPTISGTAMVGQTLTEAHGTWTNTPTTYSYQWETCNADGIGCAVITGAINQSYTLISADTGHTLRVAESATNAGGSGGPVTSAATSEVP